MDKKAYIKEITSYLPQQTLTNEDLALLFPEWSVDKIAEKVGVHTRHIAANDETAADMAYNAAQLLLGAPNVDRSSIDFVLLCTQSPDYFLPTSACILQHRLGLKTICGAFDFNLGCSGYVYGLALAKGLIVAGVAKNILLLTAETYTRYIHPTDKGNRTIFGDAATASLISTDGFAEIKEFSLGTDGSGSNHLIVQNGGMRHPQKGGLYENGVPCDNIFMEGAEIFSFTLKEVPKLVKSNLEINGVDFSDIDLFVFHQANKYMLEQLQKKIKITDDKFVVCMSEVGNTVSNTIPLALAEVRKQHSIIGKRIMLVGFGVGLSFGAVIING